MSRIKTLKNVVEGDTDHALNIRMNIRTQLKNKFKLNSLNFLEMPAVDLLYLPSDLYQVLGLLCQD